MKTKFLSLFVLLFLVFSFGSCSDTDSPENVTTPSSSQIITTYNSTEDEKELARLINNYRSSKGFNQMEIINHISYKAQEHNLYMIERNVVNHDNFENRANNIMEVLGAVKVAENIAFNYSSPVAALTSWLESPNHKENLDGDFTHFGLSITMSPTGKSYYTTIFMKR